MKTEIQANKMLSVHYKAPGLESEIEKEIASWQHKITRLWKGDASLWTNDDEGKWVGWLELPNDDTHLKSITALAEELTENNISDVVVLGMGGSSLCPDMFALTFERVRGFPRLHVLDSTDPQQILDLEKKIDLKNSFFIVSSKSGTTLEPNIYKDYFYNQLQKCLNKKEVGDRFVAITDQGTQLDKLAQAEKFKAIFYGVKSVGGRYSALSNFGLVPLGLMGENVESFLQNIRSMYDACSPHTPASENPGVILGSVLGVCGNHGKDKVTLIASPRIKSLGAWLEQLLAESTGKEGRGLIPVDQEPLGDPSVYAEDRVFAYIRLATAPDREQDKKMLALEKAGHVVVTLHVTDIMNLGAELFRWEIATAVAGSVLKINPFNQPDVEEAKVLALKLTGDYEKTGKLEKPQPFYSSEGIELFADKKLVADIFNDIPKDATLKTYLQTYLELVKPHDYIDFAAFINRSDEHTHLIEESRVLLRKKTKLATCLGFGPRFLHSTGQAYKGGPNTGIFFQITCDHHNDIQVPEHKYSFGLVITAQAQADFTVLTEKHRRVLRIHFKDNVANGLTLLNELFKSA